MIATVLTILKVLGITLLILLGIIFLLLLLILFVPVRYRLDGEVPETDLENGFDIEKISFSAKFSWLLHFVSGGIEFPANQEFTLKIFGIKILPLKEKDKKNKKKEKSKESDKETEYNSDNKNDGDTHSENVSEESKEIETEDKKSDELDVTVEDDETNIISEENCSKETEAEEDDSDNDKALIEIVTDIIEKISNFLTKPLSVIEKIKYTTSRLCDKIGMIKSTLENEIFKRAFDLVKRKLIILLKMLIPDKSDVNIRFGTGDPADTASVMAVYGALYPVLYNKVNYEPDFDRKVICADAHIRGHITTFTVLYCVLVCYFNKDVKKVIKRFKKIKNS